MVTGFDHGTLGDLVHDHGKVARIVIAVHAGSAPREAGTAMYVWSDGQMGTIGGGALELQATKAARSLIAEGRTAQVLKLPLGPALGQCCGGSVTLVIEPFEAATLPEPNGFYARPVAPNTDQTMAVRRLIRAARNGSSAVKISLKDGWLIEPALQPSQPLWIYGAGHVGRAIVDTLDGLAFDITWVDTAADRFPENIRPDVTPLVATDPALAATHAPKDAGHLVLTYSHALDLALCNSILRRPFASLGLIGSQTKRARFRTKLRALGHSDAQISRIVCPIGDPSLGKEPKAIALGVVSALLRAVAQTSAKKETAT